MANPLDRAARYLRDAIAHAAPTEKSAASFRIVDDHGDKVIVSADPGTEATNSATRHPLFGLRSHWYGPAGRQLGKKHFVQRAASRAAREAQRKLGQDFERQILDENDWLGR